MKKSYLIISFLLFSAGLNAQVLVSEDFSTASAFDPPTNWNNIDLGTSGIKWAFSNPGGRDLVLPITDPAAIFDSEELGTSTSQENAVLESPTFNASTGSIVLEFDHYFREMEVAVSEYSVEVWNGTSWTQVLSGDVTLADNPEHVALNITAATGGSTAAKVRFHWTGQWDTYWIVDNIKISRVTCVFPSNPQIANVTLNTASFSWTAGGSETNWDIEYGSEGFTQGTGTLVPANGTPAYAFNGLTSATDYDVYIRSNCGGGDVSIWIGPFKFSTLCQTAIVSTYPWTENFDDEFIDAHDMPCSWLVADANNDTYTWSVTDQISNSAPNSLAIPYGDGAMNDWAYTPGFAMVAGTTYRLTFDYAVSSPDIPENMKVSIGNAQTAAAMTTVLDDLPAMVNPDYLTDIVNFTVPTTGTYYIGFHGYSNPLKFYITLDNMKLEECPGCPLAIEENAELAGIDLYPNPSTGLVHVISPASNGTLNVSVVDFTGKEVLALPGTVQGAFDIDLSGFDNGVYFVKFLSGDTQSTQRIVVTK